MQAAYNGSGDVTVATRFSCVAQPENAGNITPGDMVQIMNSLRQRELILPNR